MPAMLIQSFTRALMCLCDGTVTKAQLAEAYWETEAGESHILDPGADRPAHLPERNCDERLWRKNGHEMHVHLVEAYLAAKAAGFVPDEDAQVLIVQALEALDITSSQAVVVTRDLVSALLGIPATYQPPMDIQQDIELPLFRTHQYGA